MNIPSLVKGLGLPNDSYIVVGSGIMHVSGIRQAGDIDLIVTRQAYNILLGRGWREMVFDSGDTGLQHDMFEASMWLPSSRHKLNVAQLVEHSVVVDGVPFASLEYVLDWKKRAQREKDLHDIKLLEAHLAGLANM